MINVGWLRNDPRKEGVFAQGLTSLSMLVSGHVVVKYKGASSLSNNQQTPKSYHWNLSELHKVWKQLVL